MPRYEPDNQPETMSEVEISRLLASLPGETRENALRSFQREALQEAVDILSAGKRAPVEQPQKNLRRPMDENVI